MQQDRKLTARSVVASLLLGMRRPELAGRSLVGAAERLGFSEGTIRVALTRMVAAGELTTSDGRYALAGPLLDRHGRQEEGRRPQVRRWDGTWRVGIVGTAGARRPAADRAGVRRQLAAVRCAEWREGVWVRPDNIVVPAVAGCAWWTGARPAEVPAVDRLWDLSGWMASAEALRAAMDATPPAPDTLRASFDVAAAVVRLLRDDPLLPEQLLPAGWPAPDVRHRYDGYEADFQAALRAVVAGDRRRSSDVHPDV